MKNNFFKIAIFIVSENSKFFVTKKSDYKIITTNAMNHKAKLQRFAM